MPVRTRRRPQANEPIEEVVVPEPLERLEHAAETQEVLKQVLHSVVKIYCTYVSPNFSLPWQKERQNTCTSSGFVIAGRRILCNAHGVTFHSAVRIRKHGDSEKYLAKVLHEGHECDLALLTVESEAFWEGLMPLAFEGIPNLQDEVVVVGYPTGGDNISVTQGIVSRVAVGKYSLADHDLLSIQIDAAINSGNSGGPALFKGKVVGVAFETLDGAENIGYIIPIPVVEHFLNDIAESGRYRGFCQAGFAWQHMENLGLRESLGLEAGGQVGVRVSQVFPLTSGGDLIKVDDVVVGFDDVPIASDGTILFRNGERINFSHLVSSKYVGGKGRFQLFRDGKHIQVEVTLTPRHQLVRSHMYNLAPSYFIYGGLVFSVLSCPLMAAEYGEKWDKKAPIELCDLAWYGFPKREGQQVVVLNQVLTCEPNIGYEDICNAQVKKANGEEIWSLRQLAEIVVNNKGKFLRVDLYQHAAVVVSCAMATQHAAKNLADNNVAQGCSDDLLPVFQPHAKKTFGSESPYRKKTTKHVAKSTHAPSQKETPAIDSARKSPRTTTPLRATRSKRKENGISHKKKRGKN